MHPQQLHLFANSAIPPDPSRVVDVQPQPIDPPNVAVAVVIRGRGSRKSVLAVRRTLADEKCPRWGFPGGKIRLGERVKSAAIRELKEETGLVVRRGSFIGCRVHPMSGVRIFYYIFRCEEDVARACEPNKLDRVEWISVISAKKHFGGSLYDRVIDHLGQASRARGRKTDRDLRSVDLLSLRYTSASGAEI